MNNFTGIIIVILALAMCSCTTVKNYRATKTKDGRDYYIVFCSNTLECFIAAKDFCPKKTPITFLDPNDNESPTIGLFRDTNGKPYVRMVCKR